jgi:PKD repeat protein
MRILLNGYNPSCFRLPCLRLLVGIFLILISSFLSAAPTAYTDKAEFHNALALLGYTATHEGFEDEAAWGDVRSFITTGFKTAPSISNLGMTWTSNYVAGNITTGEGPARSGSYGFYSYLHGSYSTPDPGSDCYVPGECGDGWRGTADNGVFIAMGGYIDTNTPYAKLGMFIGQYPNIPVDFGESCDDQGNNCVPASTIGTAQEFFGVIDPDGFSSFEYRELEGKLEGLGGDIKYIFADDFYFVISQPPAPTVLVNPVGGLVTTESGSTNTFNVVLSAQPTADVNIALTSSNTAEGVVSPAGLAFTGANWDSAQTVTITGQDDALPDGNAAYAITVAVAASADADYAGLAAIDVGATNIDDETACCDIVYVNDDASGSNTGENWNDAYTDLQDALSNIGSGEIWVASGSYKPGTTRADTFQMRSHVALYGGFSGTEIARGQRDLSTHITILDGDLLGDDYYRWVNGHAVWSDVADNSHHIVTGSNADTTAVLDGFVLAHGYARGAGGDPGPSIQGGGSLLIQNGSPTIRNVTIDGASGAYGGGAYIFDSSPSFSDCEFLDNYADIGRAGAVYIGGASSVTFTNCLFQGNAAIGTQSPDGLGGAAYIDFGATANFTGSFFIGNLANYRTNDQGGATQTKGGAILAGGDVLVRDSYFFSNKAHYGGAIYAFSGLTLINNVFDGNKAITPPTGAGGLGGALILSDISTLIGNTITANDSAEDAGGIYLTSGADVLMVNNILWGNTISKYIPPEEDQVPIAKIQLHNGGGMVDVSYGVFEGLYQPIAGEDPVDPANFPGVVDADPLFADLDGADDISGNQDDDLRPGTGSPAIDSGDNSAVPIDVLTDINGDQRFQDDPATADTGNGAAPIVDMGAYEIGGTTPANQPPVAVPSASPLSGEAPLPVQFNSTGSNDPDGFIVSYAWIFGDGGTNSTPAPSHVYNTSGNYTAYLTVTDDDGASNTDSVVISVLAPVPNQDPVAVISAIPTSGTTPLDVSFDGSVSDDGDGTIMSYQWDFGDGNSGSGISTTHTYIVAGNYTAWLTVTDDDGATASEAELITVTDPPPPNFPPTAHAGPDQVIPDSDAIGGESVSLYGSGSSDNDGSINAYAWSWAGGSSSGVNPTVSIPDGTTVVTLTVTDDDGATDTDTVAITVEAPPPPSFIDQYSTTSNTQEGAVNGSHTNTHVDDGTMQSVTEQESGGNPRKRQSSLQHQWTFSVSPGTGISLTANAWISGSADVDQYIFAYSTDGSGYTDLFTVSSTNDGNVQMAVLPAGLDGTVYVRVVDSNNGQGERVLGQLSVDYLLIRTNNTPVTPPTAGFTHICTGLDCGFTDISTDSDGTIVSWSWDFGDGNNSTAQTPSHSYAASGTYTVALTATDDDGASDTSIQDVTVSEPQADTPVHVGDLSATATGKKRWTALVTIMVHDGSHQAESGVTVSGSWSDVANGNCQTDAAGQCTLSRASKLSSLTFTVDGLSGNGVAYDPLANEEASITIDKP